MPIIKSAKKRVRVAKRASAVNSKVKRNLKTSLRSFATKSNDANHKNAQSAIDKALKKHLIHKNKAARLKRRASKRAKAAGLKIQKTPTKKTTVKKAAPKTKKK